MAAKMPGPPVMANGKPVRRKKTRTDEHETPDRIFKDCDDIWHFTIDVAASPARHKCAVYWTEQQNALVRRWYGRCWLNCPYGQMLPFMRHANEQAKFGTLIVALCPAAHGTRWYRENCLGAKIIQVGYRLTFVGSEHKAIFDSYLIIWNATRFELAQLGARELSVSYLFNIEG